MRLLFVIAVIALGADALLYNGSYTQRTWREASVYAERLIASIQTKSHQLDPRG